MAAIAIAAIVAVLAIAGCTVPQNTVTPTPAPSVTPTPTPVPTMKPGNQTVERQYQFVERFYAGIDQYNSGIALMREANSTAASGDNTNASSKMLEAKGRMDTAISDFQAMSQLAGSDRENSLSQKWAEAARYESMSFQNASDAYSEFAYQLSRTNPNLVKYNYYVEQANYYANLALDSRRQADIIQSTITFMVPTASP